MVVDPLKPLTLILVCLSLLPPTTPLTILPLSTNCLCDISSTCDNECCCDTACPQSAITAWSSVFLCKDDTLPIPLCSTLQTPQTYELYNGLTTIYNVIKNLFCLHQINFIDPTTPYNLPSTTTSTTFPTQPATNPAITALDNITITLPMRVGMGVCATTSTIKVLHSVVNERCYLPPSSPLLNPASYPTFSQTLLPTCNTTLCNVVVQLRVYFQLTNSTWSVSQGHILIGNTNNNPYVSLLYSYQFSTMARSANVGYTVGSTLQLFYTNGSYYKVTNPLHLNFRSIDGRCGTSSDDASLIQLRFNVNAIHTCTGTSSQLYSTLINTLSAVGMYGSATTNPLDYVKMTHDGASFTTASSVQLLIHYVRIGQQKEEQYMIIKVEANAIPSDNGQIAFYVEYVLLTQPLSLFVPPPPSIDAYLPNDFLYPFNVV